jgi:hypothetical protein
MIAANFWRRLIAIALSTARSNPDRSIDAPATTVPLLR